MKLQFPIPRHLLQASGKRVAQALLDTLPHDQPLPAGAPSKPAPPVPTRIFDLLTHQISQYPQPDALASKVNGEWRKYSAQEIANTVRALAAGLHAAGVRPGDLIANSTETNRPEWNFIDLAVLSLGAVHVPIYPTLTSEEVHYILEDSGSKLVFVSTEALRAKVATVIDRLPALQAIYTYDSSSSDTCAAACSWHGLRLAGETLLSEHPAETNRALDEIAAAVRPEDLATLIYTSGTTGQPKGVMLSHTNLVSNCMAIVPLIHAVPGERTISFLPLCHIFERTLTNAYLYSGMPVYYAESLDRIGENMREIRPRFFAAVPRILEKVFERIMARGNALNGRRKQLFFWALELAERIDPEAPIPMADHVRLAAADQLVFSKWRAALGGRVNGIVCGSAALNPRLARIFWNAGVKVYEGYGPTEAAPVITSNHREHGAHRIGTVGQVIEGGEVKIAEDGEILYRGPNVMLGYYHRPDLTAETVDSDGYLHTGDVGEFVEGEDGVRFLRITDRKKEIFKTSGGKYIAPQPLENRLKESPYVAQAMVVGEYQKFPGALIVPNFTAVRTHLGAHEPLPAADADLVREPAVHALIASEVKRLNADFAQYAQVKDFRLLAQEWTADSGELTPTQKLKRREIVKKFAGEIASLYSVVSR